MTSKTLTQYWYIEARLNNLAEEAGGSLDDIADGAIPATDKVLDELDRLLELKEKYCIQLMEENDAAKGIISLDTWKAKRAT